MVLRQLFRGTTNCDLVVPYKTLPPPSYPTFLPKLAANFLAIEKWATYFSRNCITRCEHEVVFSVPTTLSGTVSPPWQAGLRDMRLKRLKMLFGNAVDSQPVTVTALRNGNVIAEITMPANDNVVNVEEADLDPDQRNFGLDGEFLTFQCTDLGANEASAVTVIAYFDCAGTDGVPPDSGGGGA